MAMWYLIIPPIIIVFCLALLLWYLSRKGSDPRVLAKIEEEKPRDKKTSFLQTKNFLLKRLEKMTQRFKVRTLKIHNAIGAWSQSLKKKREIVGELAARQKNAALRAEEKKSPVSRLRFWKRSQKKAREISALPASQTIEREAPFFQPSPTPQNEGAVTLGEPLVRRREHQERLFPASSKGSGITPEAAEEENPRPMVSESVTEPEVRRKRQRQNTSHEEMLIERIAENPKDFTAYEALGDYYMSVDNTEDAKECYRQVLKLRPVHRLVKIKIRRLEKILTEKA